MPNDVWIGVAEVAEEMHYTHKEAWAFIRKIGLVGLNTGKMKLARFTRAEFEEAIERSKRPLAPIAKTGVLASANRKVATTKKTDVDHAAIIAAKIAEIRKA